AGWSTARRRPPPVGTAATLLGGASFVTQLPEQWVVGLAPAQRIAARLTQLTLVGVAVDVLLTLALLLASAGLGRPFGGLLPYFGRRLLAGAGPPPRAGRPAGHRPESRPRLPPPARGRRPRRCPPDRRRTPRGWRCRSRTAGDRAAAATRRAPAKP